MSQVLLVFRNAFRGILYARSLYLWIIAVVIVGAPLALQITFRDTPPNLAAFARPRPAPPGMSEEQKKQFEDIQKLQQKQLELQTQAFQEQFRRNRPVAFANALSTWTSLAIFFGILLGANVLANEVSAKTVITVLARPIRRWELLLGKWLAIQMFGVMSLAVGVVIHFAVGNYLGFHFSSVLWLALMHSMVSIMLYSAIAMAVGTFAGWMVAGGVSFVMYFIPSLVTFLKEDTIQWRHLLGAGLDWIVPPGFKSLYLNSVDVARELDHSAMSKVLMENFAYCAIFFVLACIIFSRREVRLG
ncbi:MAG TPA: ABC transporter permease subunit [Terriglobia bacterium]|nr:ABC transporter permease subunit [Terriglobia bacterium]